MAEFKWDGRERRTTKNYRRKMEMAKSTTKWETTATQIEWMVVQMIPIFDGMASHVAKNTRQHKIRHTDYFAVMWYSIRLQVCCEEYFVPFFSSLLFASDYHHVIELKFLWDWCVIHFFFIWFVHNEKWAP